MNSNKINQLRHSSRKLIRELGILQLDKTNPLETPQYWHALTEIVNNPNIKISELGEILLLQKSTMSRVVAILIKDKMIIAKNGADKREKRLLATKNGLAKFEKINEFSDNLIRNAFTFLKEEEQEQIITAITNYASALEKSRSNRNSKIKILTLTTSRTLRQQIFNMIYGIQRIEFALPVTKEMNACILRAEEEFYYDNSCNFWYAADIDGKIIGSIALKKIDKKNAEIKKFFVAKEYRGCGVAQKLLRKLVKEASKHNFTKLFLGTVHQLKIAQKFYKKYGFKEISAQELPKNFQRCPIDDVFFAGNLHKIIKTQDE